MMHPTPAAPATRRRRWSGARQPGDSRTSAWLWLAVLLGGAGAVHLWRPGIFDPIVPELLPGPARAYTYGSGAVELGLALGLILPRTRSMAGLGAALFFVAVFPANVKMAVDAVTSAETSTAHLVTTLARLPLQIPLVIWGWRVHRAGQRTEPAAGFTA